MNAGMNAKTVIISIGTGLFNSRIEFKRVKHHPDFKECLRSLQNRTKEDTKYLQGEIEIVKNDTKKYLEELDCNQVKFVKKLKDNNVMLLASENLLSQLACEILSEYFDVQTINEIKMCDLLIPCNEDTVVQDVIYGCKNNIEVVDVKFTNSIPKDGTQREWQKWGRLID